MDFIDGSCADFKEFIETTETVLEKYKYAYNYRAGPVVLFRYDNAPDPRAKSLSSYPHHKHLESGEIVKADPVELSEFLKKIEKIILIKWNL